MPTADSPVRKSLQAAYDADQADQAERTKQKLYLKEMGDPREGGTLPLGGKASAPGGGGNATLEKAGISVRKSADYPLNMHPAEKEAYDALMNRHESELQDLETRIAARKNQ